MDGGKKNSFKILSTNDIRKHAQNWTLAGDVGLLAHLEQFSENICNKTQETQKYFNELLDTYDEVYTKIGNITNQLLALQNCQFVENRVYDEETPTEEKPQPKVEDEVEQEKLLLKHYKKAVEVGIKLLDTHFQEVQIPPNSDSDEDDEISAGNTSYIWRPKNPYAGKKFPLLIGSVEWWADDNVGLGEYEENLDTERIMSESDSDIESTQGVEKRIQLSTSSSMENEKLIPKKPLNLDSSSEDLFGLDKNENFNSISPDLFPKTDPVPKKSQNFLPPFKKEIEVDSENKEPLLNKNQVSEEPDNASQDDSLTNKHRKVDNAFSRELAAKLVSVNLNKDNISSDKIDNLSSAKEKQIKDENVSTHKIPILPSAKPIEKPSRDESLFDEGDDSDIFSGTIKNFSDGNKSLFFDVGNDDELFSGSNNLFFESNGNTIFDSDAVKCHVEDKPSQDTSRDASSLKKESVLPKETLVNDLFGNIEDDETIFTSKPTESKQSIKSLPVNENQTFRKKLPELVKEVNDSGKGLFESIDNEFEDIETDKLGFFDSEENKGRDFRIPNAGSLTNKDTKSFFEDTSEIYSPVSNVRSIQNVGNKAKKPEDTLEPNSSAILPPKTKHSSDSVSSLFSSADKKISFVETDETKDDLFSKSFIEDRPFEKHTSSSKMLGFQEDDDTSLFLDKPKQQDTASISSSRSSIFDDISMSKSRLASVFEKDKNNKMEDDLFNASDNSLFGSETLIKTEGIDFFSSKTKSKDKNKTSKTSLFDDCDDTDDLFGLGKEEDDLFGESSLFEKSKLTEKGQNLFKEEKKKLGSGGKEVKESVQAPKVKKDKEEDILNKEKKELGGDVKKIKESTQTLSQNRQLLDKEEDLFSEEKKGLEGSLKESTQTVKKPEKPKPMVNKEDLFKEKKRDLKSDVKEVKHADNLFASETIKVKSDLPKNSFINDLEDDFEDDLFKSVHTSLIQRNTDSRLEEKPVAKPEKQAIGIPAVAENNPKLVETKCNILRNQSELLKTSSETFFDDLDDTELFRAEKKFSDTSIIKPKPPSSLSLSKEAETLESNAKTKNIGKLNISNNLKVRLETIAKHSPMDVKIRPERRVEKEEKVDKKTEELDGPFEPSSNLLKCPSKDRVKIPVGRRPQSRRARQEAIRNSGSDFAIERLETAISPFESTKTSVSTVLPQNDSVPVMNSPGPLFPSPVASNPLSPSTDEEDYFNVPELDTYFEKEDQSIFKSSLFQSSDSPKIDDNLLFDGAPVLSPLSPKKDASSSKPEQKVDNEDDSLLSSSQTKLKRLNIFGEEDDDDNSLFKTPEFSKKENKNDTLDIENSSLFSQSKNFVPESKNNKPLFDTFVDDGEDLFGNTSVVSKIPTEKITKSIDKSVQSKDKGNPSFVDPLGLMSKDD